MATKTIAVVTIRGAGTMTRKGRKLVADWLRAHATMLMKRGPEYSTRFTGRYLSQ